MPDHFDLILTPQVRAWIYRVAVALVPLLSAWGYIADESAPQILAVIAALMSTSVAAVHTPTKGR